MSALAVAVLHRHFRLDADTGRLFWKECRASRVKPGDEADTTNSRGYRVVKLNQVLYYVHRVIFAMTQGRWPKDEIDHINRNKSDNRPSNLREATRSENQRNTGWNKDNTSGEKGVCWDKTKNKWHAQIQVKGRTLNLGSFDDLELAGLVYICAAEKYHGQFAGHLQ